MGRERRDGDVVPAFNQHYIKMLPTVNSAQIKETLQICNGKGVKCKLQIIRTLSKITQ